jgi:IS5 family transposase
MEVPNNHRTAQELGLMLRDRYESDKFFMGIQQLTNEMDTVLAQIDGVLDNDTLFERVKADLSGRYPRTQQTGRRSTPVEVILRMLVVKHLYNLSYEKTEQSVKDSLVLRRFCRVYFEAVPDDTTLMRWANQISGETLEALNSHIVHLATGLKVTAGRKLRTDGTVVETNIHYPSDSRLLGDGVRVLSRLMKRAQKVLGEELDLARSVFRDRSRSTRYVVRRIERLAHRGAEKTQHLYKKLVKTVRASVRQAQKMADALQHNSGAQATDLRQDLSTFIVRTQQVIEQTVRRVFEQEVVPAADKLVSLFEPHTDIIKRGKAGKPVEFGHKVWLDEVDGGIISHYRILDGNPGDSDQWQPSLDQHMQQFGKPPHQASADRGVYSADNERYATHQGVKRVILPQPGTKSHQRQQHERQAWFRRGRRWHAGVEGRISVVKRKHGLDRCRNHGQQGFARWVGWGIIAANLAVIGRTLAARS